MCLLQVPATSHGEANAWLCLPSRKALLRLVHRRAFFPSALGFKIVQHVWWGGDKGQDGEGRGWPCVRHCPRHGVPRTGLHSTRLDTLWTTLVRLNVFCYVVKSFACTCPIVTHGPPSPHPPSRSTPKLSPQHLVQPSHPLSDRDRAHRREQHGHVRFSPHVCLLPSSRRCCEVGTVIPSEGRGTGGCTPVPRSPRSCSSAGQGCNGTRPVSCGHGPGLTLHVSRVLPAKEPEEEEKRERLPEQRWERTQGTGGGSKQSGVAGAGAARPRGTGEGHGGRDLASQEVVRGLWDPGQRGSLGERRPRPW